MQNLELHFRQKYFIFKPIIYQITKPNKLFLGLIVNDICTTNELKFYPYYITLQKLLLVILLSVKTFSVSLAARKPLYFCMFL